MRQSHHREKGTNTAEEISTKIEGMLDRLHAIVIGPGLGRDSLMQDTAKLIIEAAKKKGMPFVVDAVSLFVCSSSKWYSVCGRMDFSWSRIIRPWSKIIHTPS